MTVAMVTWTGSPFGYSSANLVIFSDPSGLCRFWDLQCKVEVLAHVATARFGTVVESVGDGAIQLVKLG